jgi:integrative and conjugative element protein (TIGR02256 family)
VSDDFRERLGPIVALDQLIVAKARALATHLESDAFPCAHLVEVRQLDALSAVAMEVAPEVGQLPKHDIRRREPITVVFGVADQSWPEVLALRPDFPRYLPHLNLRPADFPPSLCVSEQPYEEVKWRWTPGAFLRMILNWLSLTARGELHRDDQPLEPFLAEFEGHLIVPQAILSQTEGIPPLLYGYQCPDGVDSPWNRPVYRLFDKPMGDPNGSPRFVAAIFTAPIRQHGVIHHKPATLAELVAMIGSDDFDLLRLMKNRLVAWKGVRQSLDANPILLIQFPVTRQAGGDIERHDLWAFLLSATVCQIGERLDLWRVQDGKIGTILQPDGTKRGQDIEIGLLNPHPTLSRARAAELSNVPSGVVERIVAIGAGALGSQVAINLTRLGLGPAAIIDEDHVLPHNLVRHASGGDDLGLPKAIAVARASGLIIDETPAAEALAINVLAPGNSAQRVATWLRSADFILDTSASIAVARYLAIDLDAPARRVSLFLNPSGYDLVLLREDAGRFIGLDQLEMQYYWALATREELHRHLEAPDRVRYARSCRDLSSRISQIAVAIHAGIGSDAICKSTAEPTAAITIWQLAEADCTVRRLRIDACPMRRAYVGDWSVVVGEQLMQDLIAQRAAKLPSETGGVLIGECDTARRRIYLVGSIAAPPDSVEWPTHYIRGSRGLQRKVGEVTDRTDGMLRYMGEWHSHPDGALCRPSPDDRQAYEWLSQHMRTEGYPPVMLIVGEDGTLCCVVDEHDEMVLPQGCEALR